MNTDIDEQQKFVRTRWRVSSAFDSPGKCKEENISLPFQLEFEVESGKIHYAVLGADGLAYVAIADPKKPIGGNGEFSLAFV